MSPPPRYLLHFARLGLVLAWAGVLLAPAAAPAAPTRDVELRFLAPSDPVDGYRFYLRDESTQQEQMVDVGMVLSDAQGVSAVVVRLDAARSYGVQVTAYNAAGESVRSNGLLVAAAASPLIVDALPTPLAPGRHIVTLTGSGFSRKPKIKFMNGEGKRPKAKVLRILDENTLEVQLKIKHKQLHGATAWDMWVRLKGGEPILVPRALRVEPL